MDDAAAPAAAAPTAAAPVAEKPAANGASAKAAPVAVAAPAIAARPTALVAAAPSTRRLARELGVDLGLIAGTGPGGRVGREDVKNFLMRGAGGGAGFAAPPLPDFATFGPIERKPLNAIGKASAKNLSISWRVVPHVTQQELADITDLETARKDFVARAKGPKVTMTVLAMKAVLAAVREFPQFNASFDDQTNETILKKYYTFGVAVDTAHGLMVPVIRDVDKKSISELAAEISEVAELARQRKLPPDRMKGGTFTISNLGGLGGSSFTPIVNWPEVAILGIARARQEYVIHDGKPQFRLICPLSLSYDHRAINGADGARFVTRLSSLLASPFALLSEA